MLNRFSCAALALAAAGICHAAAPAAPAPADGGAIKFVARYEMRLTVDPNRNAEVASAIKAAKGAMSLVGGEVAAGTIEDSVSIGSSSYSVSSRGKANGVVAAVLGGDSLTRSSEGATGGGYLASQKFSETRGAKRRLSVAIDYAQRTATYHKNGKLRKKEEVQYRLADSASVPYLFLRQPLPTRALTVAATDGLSTRLLVLIPSDDTVQIGKDKVPALHLSRSNRQGDDASFDLWLRKDDGMPLRIRVGLDNKYGVVLDQKLTELPPVVK